MEEVHTSESVKVGSGSSWIGVRVKVMARIKLRVKVGVRVKVRARTKVRVKWIEYERASCSPWRLPLV